MSGKSISYNDFIEGIKLKSIHISHLEANRKDEFHPPATISVKSSKGYEELKDGIIKMEVEYFLSGLKEEDKEPGFTISVTYTLLYQSKIKISETYFKKFSKSLDIETWPYFRNLVNELTMRMGLPPLVLDLLKVIPKVKRVKKTNKL